MYENTFSLCPTLNLLDARWSDLLPAGAPPLDTLSTRGEGCLTLPIAVSSLSTHTHTPAPPPQPGQSLLSTLATAKQPVQSSLTNSEDESCGGWMVWNFPINDFLVCR